MRLFQGSSTTVIVFSSLEAWPCINLRDPPNIVACASSVGSSQTAASSGVRCTARPSAASLSQPFDHRADLRKLGGRPEYKHGEKACLEGNEVRAAQRLRAVQILPHRLCRSRIAGSIRTTEIAPMLLAHQYVRPLTSRCRPCITYTILLDNQEFGRFEIVDAMHDILYLHGFGRTNPRACPVAEALRTAVPIARLHAPCYHPGAASRRRESAPPSRKSRTSSFTTRRPARSTSWDTRSVGCSGPFLQPGDLTLLGMCYCWLPRSTIMRRLTSTPRSHQLVHAAQVRRGAPSVSGSSGHRSTDNARTRRVGR